METININRKVLVIGLGSMGRRRIRNLQTLGFVSVFGFDVKSERRKEVESLYQIKTIDSFEKFREEGFDAFIISVPPDLHPFYMKAAIENNIHYFVEVNMIDTDYEKIIKDTKAKGIVGAPSATLYFHPAVQTIFDIVKSGELGEVTNFIYHSGQYLPDWRTYEDVSEYYVSSKSTGGAREIVPFELTWISKLLGFPKSVQGIVRKTMKIKGAEDIDDTYNILLNYEHCIVNLVVDVVSRHATRKLLINGTEKQLLWNWEDNFVKIWNPPANTWETRSFNVGKAAKGYNPNIPEQMYVDELHSFFLALEGKKPFFNSILYDHNILRLLYASEQSSDSGSTVLFRPEFNNPTIGLLIIARLGSTRLNQKHLIKVNGKTLIEYLVDRLKVEFKDKLESGSCKIVIATSTLPENKEFENVFKNSDVEVFYGNDENIPLRQLECAEHFNFEIVIPIDGDDFLCSTEAAKRVSDQLEQNENSLMAKSIGLPLGMNITGYKASYLKHTLLTNVYKKLETGWGKIFNAQDINRIIMGRYDEDFSLRFTLDYPEDAEFFIAVIQGLGEKVYGIRDGELISYVQSNKLNDLNKSLNEQYWKNFNSQQKSEVPE